jgi:hypothetical protein
MSAFQPIPPKHAAELIEAAGMGEEGKRLILELAAAGAVKGYASMIETTDADGSTIELRDPTIPRAIWKRIMQEGKASDVWSGAVRLAGSGLLGGTPAVNVIGIRFKRETILHATATHGSAKPCLGGRKPAAKPLREAPVASPTSPTPQPIDLSVPWVSVKTAARALSVGRTKLYDMMSNGELDWQPIGDRGRRISTSSIVELCCRTSR